MTSTRRRGPAPVGPGLGSAAFRGALLIAVAVLLGAGLLAKSFDSGGPASTGSPARSTSTTAPATQTTPATTAVAHNPAEVKVLVLNGVDPSKAIAGPAAQALKAANYTTLSPADAKTMVPASAVYYLAGYEADAQQIAAKLGIAADKVQPLPNPPPPSVADPKDAHVIVVIGPDSTFGGATATTAAN
jgi:hypothetical protein